MRAGVGVGRAQQVAMFVCVWVRGLGRLCVCWAQQLSGRLLSCLCCAMLWFIHLSHQSGVLQLAANRDVCTFRELFSGLWQVWATQGYPSAKALTAGTLWSQGPSINTQKTTTYCCRKAATHSVGQQLNKSAGVPIAVCLWLLLPGGRSQPTRNPEPEHLSLTRGFHCALPWWWHHTSTTHSLFFRGTKQALARGPMKLNVAQACTRPTL